MTTNTETGQGTEAPLVRNVRGSSFDASEWLDKRTKNKAKEATIRRKTVNGRKYYYFCQGAKRVYLGTADEILSWKPKRG